METKFDKIIDSYKTEPPFKVPENYFNTFNIEIMSKLPDRITVQTSKTEPLWDESFFATFGMDLAKESLEKVNGSTPKTSTVWNKVKPLVYMAAMFVGVYVSISLLNQSREFNFTTNTSTHQQQTFAGSPTTGNQLVKGVTEEEFFQFIEDQLAEFRYQELLSQMNFN